MTHVRDAATSPVRYDDLDLRTDGTRREAGGDRPSARVAAMTDGQPTPGTEVSLYSDRFLDALRVAAHLHRNQLRTGTDIPYASHVLGVCSIALEFGADEDQAIAALLHDVIEDVEPMEEARAAVATFGPEVLRIVDACTDTEERPKPPWRIRKERYLERLAHEDARVLLVSASDKLHNGRAIVVDLRRHGPEVWARFSAGADQRWYYRALVELYRGTPASHPDLVGELERVVAEMERLG